MPVEILEVGQLKTNCYLVFDEKSREALIIDPGDDAEFIMAKIKDLDLKPKAILATHGHFDHVLAVTELKLAYKISFYLNYQDKVILDRMKNTAKYFLHLDVGPKPFIDKYLKDKDIISLSDLKLQVLESPGHTPGGICLYCVLENFILTGDTIFANGAFGRTDLQGGDEKIIKKSIKKILSFPENTIVYSGHGESTTIKNERKYYDFKF